jgi:hypothetical protein
MSKACSSTTAQGNVMLSYKGFLGSTDYDDDDEAEVFYGTLLNANLNHVLPRRLG